MWKKIVAPAQQKGETMSNMTDREKNALQVIKDLLAEVGMDERTKENILNRAEGYLDAKKHFEAQQNRAS